MIFRLGVFFLLGLAFEISKQISRFHEQMVSLVYLWQLDNFGDISYKPLELALPEPRPYRSLEPNLLVLPLRLIHFLELLSHLLVQLIEHLVNVFIIFVGSSWREMLLFGQAFIHLLFDHFFNFSFRLQVIINRWVGNGILEQGRLVGGVAPNATYLFLVC